MGEKGNAFLNDDGMFEWNGIGLDWINGVERLYMKNSEKQVKDCTAFAWGRPPLVPAPTK